MPRVHSTDTGDGENTNSCFAPATQLTIVTSQTSMIIDRIARTAAPPARDDAADS